MIKCMMKVQRHGERVKLSEMGGSLVSQRACMGLPTPCHLTLDQRVILGCSPHPQGGLPGMDKFSGSPDWEEKMQNSRNSSQG